MSYNNKIQDTKKLLDEHIATIDGRYLSRNLPFDTNNYGYAAQARSGTNPYLKTAQEQVLWARFPMALGQMRKPSIYGACSITGGVLAHRGAIMADHTIDAVNTPQYQEMAKKLGRLRTTKDLGLSSLGKDYISNQIFWPNLETALHIGMNPMLSLYPDHIFIAPHLYEGATKLAGASAEATGGMAHDEEEYMGPMGWPFIVWMTEKFLYNGDIPFSRNGNREEMFAMQKALGYLDDQVYGVSDDYRFIRADGSISSFAERMQFSMDYLIYAMEHDFYAMEVAACSAFKVEIARRLLDDDYNRSKANPIPVERISDDLKAEFTSKDHWCKDARDLIKALIPVMEGMLQSWFIHHVPQSEKRWIDPLPTHLQTAWQEGIAKKTYTIERPDLDTKNPLVQGSLSRLEDPTQYMGHIHHNPDLQIIATPTESLPIPSTRSGEHLRRFERQKTHLRKVLHNTAKIFDDHLVDDVPSYREGFAIETFFGGLETLSHGYASLGHTLIFTDVEKNSFAQAVAEANGIADISLLPQTPKKSFQMEDDIIRPALEAMEKTEAAYVTQSLQTGGGRPNIINQYDLRALDALYETLPDLTSKPDEPKTTPEGRKLRDQILIDFAATTVIFSDPLWAKSDHMVQNMMRATLAQCGMIDGRDDIGKTNLRVLGYDLKPISLADRIEALYEEVQHCVEANIESPVKVRTLARMLEIHQARFSHDFNVQSGKNIDFTTTEESLIGGYYVGGGPERYHRRFTEIEDYILANCADWMTGRDLSGLDKRYRDAKDAIKRAKTNDQKKPRSGLKLTPLGG